MWLCSYTWPSLPLTINVLLCVIHLPKDCFSIGVLGSILTQQHQWFSLYSSATPIFYSLVDITIVFVILKKKLYFFFWPFQPLAHFSPSLYKKCLEIVACPSYLRFFSLMISWIFEGFYPLYPTKLIVIEVLLTDKLLGIIVKSQYSPFFDLLTAFDLFGHCFSLKHFISFSSRNPDVFIFLLLLLLSLFCLFLLISDLLMME